MILQNSSDYRPLVRHGRACPGHPRLAATYRIKNVDARHEAGHDELANRASDPDSGLAQILPPTSFCIRLAISTSRRQACSRNDITRSISRSLGSGISILRGLSATFGSAFFCRSDFGSASSILPSATGARDANSVFSFS